MYEPKHLRARLEGALSAHPPSAPVPGVKQAAVAILLRPRAAGLEVLLMRRAQRESDRWSGQISLPGGAAESHDSDLRRTAERETLEEVGVDLASSSSWLGQLERNRAVARGGALDLDVTPHVFWSLADVEPRTSAEADAVFWFPLHLAWSGSLSTEHRVQVNAMRVKLPAWRFGEHLVWGMTHRMLSELRTVSKPRTETTATPSEDEES